MIFDDDSDFSSPMSPSVAYLWRPGRHLSQNWSKIMKNDDSQNHFLNTQSMSRSHQGHPRRSLDVFKCIWKVFKIFHFLVKIMIFTHHDSRAPVMILTQIHVPLAESASKPSPSARGSVPSTYGAKHSPPGGKIQNPCPPPARCPRDPLTKVFTCQIKSKFKS